MPLLREPGAPAPYQQIREILREEVLDGMASGSRIAAERDLARRFGANRATISRAIASLVNEGLLVRRVGRGTFVADGEDLTRKTLTRTVGFVMPYIEGIFPAGMIRSALRELRDRGYKAVLFDSEDSIAEEASELERLVQEDLDGGLVMPVERRDNIPLFNRLSRLGEPLVFIDRKPVDLEGDLVATDNHWGAYQAVSRLIERGHKRIAHFTWLTERWCTSISDRRSGYEQALIDHGIEVDPELICPPSIHPDEGFFFKHSLAYLRSGNRPVTAVFCVHDQFVLATLSACQQLGLRVPEDIELSGFFDESFRPADTPLLKVVQQQEEIGRLGADLLIRRIEGKELDQYQNISVKPQIVDMISPVIA